MEDKTLPMDDLRGPSPYGMPPQGPPQPGPPQQQQQLPPQQSPGPQPPSPWGPPPPGPPQHRMPMGPGPVPGPIGGKPAAVSGMSTPPMTGPSPNSYGNVPPPGPPPPQMQPPGPPMGYGPPPPPQPQSPYSQNYGPPPQHSQGLSNQPPASPVSPSPGTNGQEFGPNVGHESKLNQNQVSQLRAQIMAYRYLARNQQIPEHIQAALQGRRMPGPPGPPHGQMQSGFVHGPAPGPPPGQSMPMGPTQQGWGSQSIFLNCSIILLILFSFQVLHHLLYLK